EFTSLHIPTKNFVVTISSNPWHLRPKHVSLRLNSLISSGCLGSIKSEHFNCDSCQLAKHHALPFNTSNSTSYASFDLIHSDIWELAPIPTTGGSQCFMIFVDDYSHYTWIYLVKNKSEFHNIYIQFSRMIHRQFFLSY